MVDGVETPVKTVTQDLSSDGFYFLAATPLVPGEMLSCTLTVPAYHPDDHSRTIPIDCQVRVVRVEALAQVGMYGIGCHINEYRVNAGRSSAECPDSALARNDPDKPF